MITLLKDFPGRAFVVHSVDARGQKSSTSGDDGALTTEALRRTGTFLTVSENNIAVCSLR